MTTETDKKSDLPGGKIRYTVIITNDNKAKLGEFAKAQHLSQGDILDVLIENIDPERLEDALEAKRSAKVDGRSGPNSILKQMKGLSPEKLAQIHAIIKGEAQ